MPDIVPVRCARVTRMNALAHAKRVRPAAAIVARVEECTSAKGFAPQDQFATDDGSAFRYAVPKVGARSVRSFAGNLLKVRGSWWFDEG
jgi:hypothetical protein